jgi:hypothetical protein
LLERPSHAEPIAANYEALQSYLLSA